MELDDLKVSWGILSEKLNKQEQLTTKMITDMTKQKFKSKLNNIGKWESAGSLICFASAIFIIASFNKMSYAYLQVFALVCVAILTILPAVSLMLLRSMNRINIAEKSYLETVNVFSRQRVKFQQFQKISFLLSTVLLVTGMPVAAAIMGKDLTKIHNYWTVIFPGMLLFFLAFAPKVLKYYNCNLKKAEETLADLNR